MTEKGSVIGFDLSAQCKHMPIYIQFNRAINKEQVDYIQTRLQEVVLKEYEEYNYDDQKIVNTVINELSAVLDYDYEVLYIDYMICV